MLLRGLIRLAREWYEGCHGRRVGRQLRIMIDEAYQQGYKSSDIQDIIIKRIDFCDDISESARLAFLIELQKVIECRDPKNPTEYLASPEARELFQ